MKRRIGIVFVCLTLMLSTVGFSVAVTNDTIYVDDDGTADYTSIQDAVDAASDGDTVYVFSGTYNEHIVIDAKSITIEGEDKDTTIINANNENRVVEVKNTDGFILKGFTLQNSATGWLEAGITLIGSMNCEITGNVIQMNDYGIVLHTSEAISVSLNDVIQNNVGLYSTGTKNCEITRNNIQDNSINGLELENSKSDSITENNFIDNKKDLSFNGIFSTEIDGNYWDQQLNPYFKTHIGFLFSLIPIPGFIIDWHPADEPYDF